VIAEEFTELERDLPLLIGAYTAETGNIQAPLELLVWRVVWLLFVETVLCLVWNCERL